MAILALKLPEVKIRTEERPTICPYCCGETFQRGGQVKKPCGIPNVGIDGCIGIAAAGVEERSDIIREERPGQIRWRECGCLQPVHKLLSSTRCQG
jgi:hypothetical protein